MVQTAVQSKALVASIYYDQPPQSSGTLLLTGTPKLYIRLEPKSNLGPDRPVVNATVVVIFINKDVVLCTVGPFFSNLYPPFE